MVRRDMLPAEVVDPAATELRRAWAGAPADAPENAERTCESAGIQVLVLGDPRYPAALAHDRAAPAVLFARGNPSVLGRRRAAVIGTRNATRSGRWFARRLGEGLARAGVSVVSGLARGIDGEAHAGALESDGAPPIGVVASGLDVVYPRENAWLWDAVADSGVLLGESPPGTAPEAHRFPLRNRIIAALAEVLVVVESAATGGSMTTVEQAALRGVDVMAVPGAPHARTSAGTNALLRDGCAPATCLDDVLCALGLAGSASPAPDRRVPPTGAAASVLAAVIPGPRTVDAVAEASGLAPLEAAVLLGRLQQAGWVECTGGWWEALAPVTHR